MTRVFWVEDNTELHPALVEALESSGDFEVFVSSGGRSALTQAKALHPHVIILDVVMPDMSGLEIASHLKQMQETRDVPIIFLTAYEMEGVDLPKGAPVLFKPVNREEIISVIQRTLAA